MKTLAELSTTGEGRLKIVGPDQLAWSSRWRSIELLLAKRCTRLICTDATVQRAMLITAAMILVAIGFAALPAVATMWLSGLTTAVVAIAARPTKDPSPEMFERVAKMLAKGS